MKRIISCVIFVMFSVSFCNASFAENWGRRGNYGGGYRNHPYGNYNGGRHHNDGDYWTAVGIIVGAGVVTKIIDATTQPQQRAYYEQNPCYGRSQAYCEGYMEAQRRRAAQQRQYDRDAGYRDGGGY